MNKKNSVLLYEQAIKNRLLWFPYFLQNEIRQNELFWYPYSDHTKNKTNIHKWFINLLTFIFDEKINIKSYRWNQMILNILIHKDDLKNLNFDNLLHTLDVI
jgi:uncharacterized protein YwqG